MAQHHIFAFGDIFNEQSEYASKDWGIVSLTAIKNQINQAPSDTDELVVHIHSGGGDVFEGFAIHDYLRSTGKKITTRTEGLCASIATIVMLAGDERYMTENSTFLIHNPIMGFAMGDADDLEAQAEFLREIEDKIINFYNKKTGQSKETLDAWMKEEKSMTPQEAKDLGFITGIVEEMKAVAFFPRKRQTKTDTNMDNLLTKLNDKFDQVLDKLGLTKPEPPAKVLNDLRLSTADGKVLIITTDADQASVNDKVRIEDGNIEDGDYTMPDGDVITVANATITDIHTKTGEQVDQNTQNDVILQLQTEVTALRDENNQMRSEVERLNGNLTTLLDNITSTFQPPQRDASFVKKDRTTEVSNTVDFNEALRRVKEKDSKK